jgi:hypothetical protein
MTHPQIARYRQRYAGRTNTTGVCQTCGTPIEEHGEQCEPVGHPIEPGDSQLGPAMRPGTAVTATVPPVCPGCHQPSTTHPPSSENQPGQHPGTWWCWACLNGGGINRARRTGKTA